MISQQSCDAIAKLAHSAYEEFTINSTVEGIKYASIGKINDASRLYWLRIGKCANTYIDHHTNSMRVINYHEDCDKLQSNKYRGFVVLRDPLERWISGAVSYFINDNEKSGFDVDTSVQIFEQLIKDKNYLSLVATNYLIEKLSYDFHGLPQVWHLYPANIKNIDFFWMNNKLGYQLNHYLKENNILNNMNNTKINEFDKKNLVYIFFSNFVLNPDNFKLKQKILLNLSYDYQLLSLVNFYTK
jgi:hypothetical protein